MVTFQFYPRVHTDICDQQCTVGTRPAWQNEAAEFHAVAVAVFDVVGSACGAAVVGAGAVSGLDPVLLEAHTAAAAAAAGAGVQELESLLAEDS